MKNSNTVSINQINYYMDLNNIRFYTDLLLKIATELGVPASERYDFVEKEKSNFSKSLRGQRPLKREFIQPLERIFGTTYTNLCSDDYKNKITDVDQIPFVRGFRYYVYKDDPILYKELLNTVTSEGRHVIANYDEFDKSFVDYVTEYKSLNGFRFLCKEFGFSLNPSSVMFEARNSGDQLYWITPNEIIGKTIADCNDATLFNKVFDIGEQSAVYNKSLNGPLYENELFIESIIYNDAVFNSLFKEKVVDFVKVNPGCVSRDPSYKDPIICNPLINLCLSYCARHKGLYTEQARKIIKFAIEHNRKVTTNTFASPHKHINGWTLQIGGNVVGGLVTSKEIYDGSSVDELETALEKWAGDNL